MTTINGYPLLDVIPNAIDGKVDWDMLSKLTENRAGLSGYGYDANHPIIGRQFAWFCDGWSEIDAMLTFLDTAKGRYQAFYMPTWHRDLEPVSNTWAAVSGGYILTIKPFGFPDIFRRLKRRRVAFINNGVVDVRALLEVGVDDNGNEYVFIAAVSPPATDDDTIISFCPLVRLSNDAVSIEWFPHEGKADITLSVTELVAEAPVI